MKKHTCKALLSTLLLALAVITTSVQFPSQKPNSECTTNNDWENSDEKDSNKSKK